MYRIFCESYRNYVKLFNENNYRLQIANDFELLTDVGKYEEEKLKQSQRYKKISDLINYMKENIKRFPRLKAFLWTLQSRNIEGKKFNVMSKEDLEEQTKLINSFIKLAYWY